MANHKSAKKRARRDIKRRDRNKQTISAIRTFEKKLIAAISSSDKNGASQLLITFSGAIDKATQKGIYHTNKAARKISRLSKRVQSI